MTKLEVIGQAIIGQHEVGFQEGAFLSVDKGNFDMMKYFYEGRLIFLHDEMSTEGNEELDVVVANVVITNTAQNAPNS